MPDLDFSADVGLHVVSESLNAIAVQYGVAAKELGSTKSITTTAITHLSTTDTNYDFPIVKHFTSTKLRVDMGMAFNNTSGVTAVVAIGITITLVDIVLPFQVAKLSHNGTSESSFVSGVRTIGPFASGAYILRPYWTDLTATGTLTRPQGAPLWVTAREVRG